MGGKITVKKTKNICGESVGTIKIEYSKLKGINIPSSLSSFLIDEYPILSIAASQAKGKTTMKGLEELRYKESDRIKSITYNFKRIGIDILEKGNNLEIHGKNLEIDKEIKIKTYGDHRIAMSFSILSLLYKRKLKIDNLQCIAISYPEFNNHLNYLLRSL